MIDKLYYYLHPESGSVFSSYLNPDEIGNPDGCLTEVDYNQALIEAELLGLVDIPHDGS